MAYDEDLANRIRELLGSEAGVEEKRMFGGLAFLVNGNMSVAASGQGGLLVRALDELDSLLKRDHVHPMVMGGRDVRGWLRVDAAGVRTKWQLQGWVNRGSVTRARCRQNRVRFAHSRPGYAGGYGQAGATTARRCRHDVRGPGAYHPERQADAAVSTPDFVHAGQQADDAGIAMAAARELFKAGLRTPKAVRSATGRP